MANPPSSEEITKETLALLGTTTAPGANQVEAIMEKVREGVRHVEIHLNGQAKGQFGSMDIPGKYSFEVRNTIRNLAKLNQQTLSVHAPLPAGENWDGYAPRQGQRGYQFDEQGRWQSVKEDLESVKFAAETAGGGAVVFHTQTRNTNDWVRKGNHFKKNLSTDDIVDKHRKYVKALEEKDKDPERFEKAKKEYIKEVKKIKFEQGIVMSDIGPSEVKRMVNSVDLEALKNLTQEEKDLLKKEYGQDIANISTAQDIQLALSAINSHNEKEDSVELKAVKDKIIVDYKNLLEKYDFDTELADRDFACYEIGVNAKANQLELAQLREYDNERYLEAEKRIRGYDEEIRKESGNQEKVRELTGKRQQVIGETFGSPDAYNEFKQRGQKKKQLLEQVERDDEVLNSLDSLRGKSITRSAESMAYMGIQAMVHQHDLIEKAKLAEDEEYLKTLSPKEREKFRLYANYKDIDPENNPLYIAPENMFVGVAGTARLEDLEELVQESREHFVEMVMNDEDYAKMREIFKKRGIDLTDKKVAEEFAERHLGATLDNAHAGADFQHFRKAHATETDDERWVRFNKWLNETADRMINDTRVVKHIHMNDTVGGTDEHVFLGEGKLDIEGLQKIIRKNTGIKEPLIVEAGNVGGHMLNAAAHFDVSIIDKASPGYSEDLFAASTTDWVTMERKYTIPRAYTVSDGMDSSNFSSRSEGRDGVERGAFSQSPLL